MENAQSTARVHVQLNGCWCEGDMIVPKPSAYRSRVYDVLNRAEPFLALTDVTVGEDDEKSPKEPVFYDVFILRKGDIKFVVPLD